MQPLKVLTDYPLDLFSCDVETGLGTFTNTSSQKTTESKQYYFNYRVGMTLPDFLVCREMSKQTSLARINSLLSQSESRI